MSEMDEKAADLLRAAKEALMELHWIQGMAAITTHGRRPLAADSPTIIGVCLVGAVDYAASRRGIFDWAIIDATTEALRQVLPSSAEPASLTDYNDAAERTKEEILALFDRAIERLEAQR